MRRVALMIWVMALAGGGSALARQPLSRPGGASLMPHAGESVLLAQAAGGRDRIIEAVQKRYGARVVRVTEVNANGRLVYELRLMSDDRARVWNIRVDAATGQVLPGAD